MSYPSDKPWLGGHGDKTHVDGGGAAVLKDRFGIAGVLDLGCGPGWMRDVWRRLGVDWIGVDGDPRMPVQEHDFRDGPWVHRGMDLFDLVWCVEVVEHLREQDVPNLMGSLCNAPVVAMTHAPPGKAGHHHVNCRDAEYWRGVFAGHGYIEDPEATDLWREESTMRKPFAQNYGMVFRRFPWT